MAGCAAQRFEGVSVAVFACLQAKSAAAGVPITGVEGQATSRGVTMRWSFDGDGEVLVIECLDKPFFVPCATLAKTIAELVEGCKPRLA